MKRKFTVFGFVLLFVSEFLNAQTSAHSPDKLEPTNLRLFVDPCSTWVSLGKVRLIISPLTLKGKFYLADYQIKVVPYFLKNEKGTMVLDASDPMVRKLLKGTAVPITGKATNTRNGRIKVINGMATPSGNDRGTVTVSIATENGLLVFNSFYHFGK